MADMTAVHVFSGYGYYPESGLGDYVTSFYGGEDAREQAIAAGKAYKAEHKKDWYCVLIDEGSGLEVLEEDWT